MQESKKWFNVLHHNIHSFQIKFILDYRVTFPIDVSYHFGQSSHFSYLSLKKKMSPLIFMTGLWEPTRAKHWSWLPQVQLWSPLAAFHWERGGYTLLVCSNMAEKWLSGTQRKGTASCSDPIRTEFSCSPSASWAPPWWKAQSTSGKENKTKTHSLLPRPSWCRAFQNLELLEQGFSHRCKDLSSP